MKDLRVDAGLEAAEPSGRECTRTINKRVADECDKWIRRLNPEDLELFLAEVQFVNKGEFVDIVRALWESSNVFNRPLSRETLLLDKAQFKSSRVQYILDENAQLIKRGLPPRSVEWLSNWREFMEKQGQIQIGATTNVVLMANKEVKQLTKEQSIARGKAKAAEIEKKKQLRLLQEKEKAEALRLRAIRDKEEALARQIAEKEAEEQAKRERRARMAGPALGLFQVAKLPTVDFADPEARDKIDDNLRKLRADIKFNRRTPIQAQEALRESIRNAPPEIVDVLVSYLDVSRQVPEILYGGKRFYF